jgi:1-deoxy-D-xylulose-5-phosphate synthase
MAPADENECRQMLYTGFQLDQAAAVRYPRGKGPGTAVEAKMTALPVGKAQLRRKGGHIALLAFGTMVQPAEQVGDMLDATVVNMRFVKPIDEAMILQTAATHGLVVTIEENVVAGGAGEAVNECLMRHGTQARTLNLGLPDRFIEHGTREEMLADAGLDAEGITRAIQAHCERIGLHWKADAERAVAPTVAANSAR